MIRNYLKIAFRVLLRRKFFTFISLFAISFTLIVLMVATAVVDHLIAPRRPETRLDRTLGVHFMQLGGEGYNWSGPPGYGFLDRYVRTLPDVERVSLFTNAAAAYSYLNGEKILSYLKRTDGEYWQILDFEFVEGGPLTSEDERDANFVAVINEATRRKIYGERSALGQTLEIDAQRFRVVGVVKNVPFYRDNPFADVWVPISTSKTPDYRRETMGNFNALVLARRREDFPAIKAEFGARLKTAELPDPRRHKELTGAIETRAEAIARPLTFSNRPGTPRQFFAALMTLMVLFMLLPTLNLININVSRILERAGEIGVRKAFGASSLTLVGQFVIENLFLTLCGGLIGLIGSIAVLRLLSQSDLIPYADLQLNYRIFLYGLLMAIFFGLFSGVYPAWRMSRLHPVEALKGGRR
jgi:putative ABC transport system permease protein